METPEERIMAWHFARDDRKLGYGDGREVVVGETLHVDVEPECCKAGLHGSRRAIDALVWAAGSQVCRVEIWGRVHDQVNKLCGMHRKVLSAIDGTEVFKSFARWCAMSVAHVWGAPDVVMDYLRTGNEKIRIAAYNASKTRSLDVAHAGRAARASSRAAASRVSGDAWGNATGSSMLDVRVAASEAAWAARAAAGEGDDDAARTSARNDQDEHLTSMLREAMDAER